MKLAALGFLISLCAADEVCYLPLDVLFLQDTTGSFDDDLPNVVKQLPDLVASVLEKHPHSLFGVTEFKDKPYFPLGETVDFCYRLTTNLTDSLETFEDAYGKLFASGGADLPEATFQALINVAKSGQVGWRPQAAPPRVAGVLETGARLVILSTDAVPHLPGDIEKYDREQYPDLPFNLPPNSGTISDDDDPNLECRTQDYPSPEQVRAAVKDAGIFVVFLTPEDPKIIPAWKWVNEELLQQPAGFYQFIKPDSSDLLQNVLDVVESVTEYLCPTTTTTTTLAPTPLQSTEPTTLTEATTMTMVEATTRTTLAPTPEPTEATTLTTVEATTRTTAVPTTTTITTTTEEPTSPMETMISETERSASTASEGENCPCKPCACDPCPCRPCHCDRCACPHHCNGCCKDMIIEVADHPKRFNLTVDN